MPFLLVRADADPGVGTGHVMRMLALAQAWRRAGGRATFTGVVAASVRQRIQDAGFEHVAMPSAHPDPSDLRTTIEIANSLGPPQDVWVALDGYHFTPEYHRAIRTRGTNLLVVDDLIHHSLYDSDIFLNQNIHAPELDYNTAPDTVELLGTRYALLREEFLKHEPGRSADLDDPPHVIVTLGGGDPTGVTARILEAIRDHVIHAVETHVIVGGPNPHRGAIERLAHEMGSVEVSVNVPNMPEAMHWADIAVCAGGSTCWELSYMGVPSVVIPIAENQRPIARGLHKAGAARTLGWHEDVSNEDIAKGINALLAEERERHALSQKAQALVDGAGADRVAAEMASSAARGRPT